MRLLQNFTAFEAARYKLFKERINLELLIGDKLCSFIRLYRSPSQSHDNFETFMKNLELNIDEINKIILS